ncbi:MAG: NAD(P)/FAD-dependent oxidoreductase, partial [Candidatus Omnitrophota bacterium]|nr:NAD(P)/FAD-dependent oxidoreductase [Candidatus Omnitrophota bacterium]
KKLNARLLREFKANPGKSIKNIFKNFLPQGIIKRFLEYCAISRDKSASQVTTGERKRLVEGLFGLKLTVEGVMPAKDGIVTRGGVNTKEINPKTMESRLVKGLFFAGEVIDIDAKTGGYNMQAAFSTGWVCGDNL